jgi:hypothetical protein
MAREQERAVLAEETHVHAACVPINAPRRFVLLSGEAPEILCKWTGTNRPLLLSSFRRL